MKKQLELLQGRIRSITSFLDNLDINAEISAEYMKIGTDGMEKWKEFYNLIKNEDEYKKLSPVEQQALHENSRAYGEFCTTIDQELKYLVNTRHSLALGDCLSHITSANQLFDKLIELLGGRDGRFSYTKLKHVREKGWDKVTYKTKLYNLITELDLAIEDYGVEMNSIDDPNIYDATVIALLVQTYTSLVQSLAWLNSEYDRIEQQGMPQAKEFKLPEVQVPKIPEDGETDQQKDTKE